MVDVPLTLSVLHGRADEGDLSPAQRAAVRETLRRWELNQVGMTGPVDSPARRAADTHRTA